MRKFMAGVALTSAILLTGCGSTMKFVSLQPQPSTQTVTFTTPTSGNFFRGGHIMREPYVPPSTNVVVTPVP